MEPYYFYVIRLSGALSVNRGVKLADNKLALLEECGAIVYELIRRGYDISIQVYAGSCVMSALGLIVKMLFSARMETLKYTRHFSVEKACERMPYIKNKKVNVELFKLFILKHKME